MKISKVGSSFAILYIVITGVVFYKAFTCVGEFCGFVAFVPIMPWPLFIEYFPLNRIPNDSILNTEFGFYIFALVNALLLYFLGVNIEKLIKKSTKVSTQ